MSDSTLPADYMPLPPYVIHLVDLDGRESASACDDLAESGMFVILAADWSSMRRIRDARGQLVLEWWRGHLDAVDAFFVALHRSELLDYDSRDRLTQLEASVSERRALIAMLKDGR